MRNTRTYHAGRKEGFTLVELLVAVALFAVVMTISMSAIFSIINANRKAQAINAVVNNLNFSIESMVRDMKTGLRYTCPKSGGTTYDQILSTNFALETSTGYDHDICDPSVALSAVSLFSTLQNGTPIPVEYRFVPAGTNGSAYGKIVHTTIGGAEYDLTSSDINVTDMRLYVTNPGTGKKLQPSIFIIINAEARITDNQVTRFHIQTLVSQRILNI